MTTRVVRKEIVCDGCQARIEFERASEVQGWLVLAIGYFGDQISPNRHFCRVMCLTQYVLTQLRQAS